MYNGQQQYGVTDQVPNIKILLDAKISEQKFDNRIST